MDIVRLFWSCLTLVTAGLAVAAVFMVAVELTERITDKITDRWWK